MKKFWSFLFNVFALCFCVALVVAVIGLMAAARSGLIALLS